MKMKQVIRNAGVQNKRACKKAPVLNAITLVGIFTSFLATLSFEDLEARQLKSLSIASGSDETVVTFNVDEGTSFDAFTMTNPPRLVVDLPRLAGSKRALGKSGGTVKSVRTGEHGGVASRFVLDLEQNVVLEQPTIARGQGGHSLIMRLKPTSSYVEQAFNHRDQSFLAAARQVNLPAYARAEATQTKYYGDTALAVTRPGQRGSKRKPVIIIDPGHGGKDPGATSVSGIDEKDLTLTFGVELASMLIKTGKYQAYLTRNSDVYIPLRERTRLAGSVDGDLFISIHADSNSVSSARGASFYTLSEEASDAEARRFADRENDAFEKSGDLASAQAAGVNSILHNMALRESAELSRTFADQLTQNVTPIWPTRPKPHKQAGFAVLKSPEMPSVLLEMGYLSNSMDEHIMLVPEYRMTLATGIKSSIDSYFRLINSDTAAK